MSREIVTTALPPIQAQAWSVLVSCRHESHPYPTFARHVDAINAAHHASTGGIRAIVLYRPNEHADWTTVHGWTPHDAIDQLWRTGPITDRACLTCGTPTGDASPPPGPMSCPACPPVICPDCGMPDGGGASCLCWWAVDLVQPHLLEGLTSE